LKLDEITSLFDVRERRTNSSMELLAENMGLTD